MVDWVKKEEREKREKREKRGSGRNIRSPVAVYAKSNHKFDNWR